MISYEPFFKTLKEKGLTTYKLINTYGLSSSLIDRLNRSQPSLSTTSAGSSIAELRGSLNIKEIGMNNANGRQITDIIPLCSHSGAACEHLPFNCEKFYIDTESKK